MNRLLSTWTLFGALTASAALNVYHAREAADPEPPRIVSDIACVPLDEPCAPLVIRLNLTPQQRQQFEGCCPTYVRRGAELDERIAALAAELECALCSDAVDAQRIDALVNEIGRMRAEELRNRIQTIVLVRKTLTPVQLEQLRTAVETAEDTP